MKTTTFFLLSLFFLASLPCFGLNYTITFTGTGASTTVGDVLVQNLTKGTSVTVPAGNVLNLSNHSTANPQKSKSSALAITMTYAKGDQLLYKGTSGNYSTVVTDVPTGSKTSNFNFTACTDADGNNYTVVTIGTQTWMAENLKTTKYNDGTAISEVTDNTAWAKNSTPAYCWYGNNATYKNTYGALYNWYAVSTAKLAPTGWHVSTDAEGTTLETYVTAHLGTSGSVAKALAATINWGTSTTANAIGNDLSKNNSSGFSALPGGKRGHDGTFYAVGSSDSWWSSTEGSTGEALSRAMGYSASYVSRYGSYNPTGYSVRCVRDSQ